MAEPYPVELRERVVKAYEAGDGSYADVGTLFDIGEASVKRWVSRYRAYGSVAARPKGGGTPSPIGAAEIDAIVERLGDPTALEITAEFNWHRRGRARMHVSSVKRALHRFGYVVKKNAAGRWRVCGRTSSKSAKRS
jgi:transposase